MSVRAAFTTIASETSSAFMFDFSVQKTNPNLLQNDVFIQKYFQKYFLSLLPLLEVFSVSPATFRHCFSHKNEVFNRLLCNSVGSCSETFLHLALHDFLIS